MAEGERRARKQGGGVGSSDDGERRDRDVVEVAVLGSAGTDKLLSRDGGREVDEGG